MAYNKVIYKGETLIDLTEDTVAPETLAVGVTAHNKAGEIIEGTFEGNNGIDTSDATATSGDILSEKTAYVKGEKITGTIATKTSNNLTASGATVTVPAGYYASNATKSVTTATRAETTISVTKDDTNDKLTLTASNNQSTGYVTGSNKTATKTVTLTTSGATATMSDGTNSVSKSIATGSAKTPATTVTKNPTISVNSSGLITASVSGTQNVTPTVSAGYVSSGTAGTVTVSGSATKQLTTQAAKTITPSTSSQTAVASGRYTTGTVTVAAIPSNYEDVGTETNEYTSLNAELEAVINSLPTTGGSGGGNVETFTLIVQSQEGVKLYGISYVAYVDGQYQYHFRDGLSDTLQYPLTFSNVVLKTPIEFYLLNGVIPAVDLVSSIEYAKATDYSAGLYGSLYESGAFLPLTTDNGQIIVRCYNDD